MDLRFDQSFVFFSYSSNNNQLVEINYKLLRV